MELWCAGGRRLERCLQRWSSPRPRNPRKTGTGSGVPRKEQRFLYLPRGARQCPLRSQGGVCGLKITAEHTFVVGETVNVQWRMDAPWLLEPYRGVDAYETHDGLMAAQVTTFDDKALKINSATRP